MSRRTGRNHRSQGKARHVSSLRIRLDRRSIRKLPVCGREGADKLSYFGPAIRSETDESCAARHGPVEKVCARIARVAATAVATSLCGWMCATERVGKYVNNGRVASPTHACGLWMSTIIALPCVKM